jgi:hypothetical protein
MNINVFTVEEENLLCIFDTSSRMALMDGIINATPDFEDAELLEIAGNALLKLENMSDAEFASLTFSPEYFDTED